MSKPKKRTDKQRLSWIQRKKQSVLYDSWNSGREWRLSGYFHGGFGKKTIRQAIDAAMDEAKGGVSEI